jgi:hypothetical protein
MATITFQMADKDVARLVRHLLDSGPEAGLLMISVRLRRRRTQEDGRMDLIWEVEMLPDNGGIYRMLLQGGKNEDVHNNQG